MDTSDNQFLECNFTSWRCPEDSLSTRSLLVSVHSKIQSVKQKSENYTLRFFARAIESAVDPIFHIPEQVQSGTPSPVSPGLSLLSTQYPNIAVPREDRDDPQGQGSVGLNCQDDDIVEEDHANLGINFGESNYDLEEEGDPDTVNGLEFSEMETVLQRASNGKILDRGRAEAPMLMLGMAGGELSLGFRAFHSFLIPSTRL